jgi:hypothetical protein
MMMMVEGLYGSKLDIFKYLLFLIFVCNKQNYQSQSHKYDENDTLTSDMVDLVRVVVL